MINAAELLEQVRASSGLTQEELARRAGTSRPTLSAYEHGRKSPTVATFARPLSQAGWALAAPPPGPHPGRAPPRPLAAGDRPLPLTGPAPVLLSPPRPRTAGARVYEIV